MVRSVGGTTSRLGRCYDYHTDGGATYPLRPWSDLSTWSIVRPIDLVNGTTHRPRRRYDLMVGPIHLVDDTTYRLR
jgi:hypothetical protein